MLITALMIAAAVIGGVAAFWLAAFLAYMAICQAIARGLNW